MAGLPAQTVLVGGVNVPRETSARKTTMPTYKELMMSRDAFLELRQKIRNELACHPETSGGQILDMENDPDTGDLVITAQYASGQRTHRLIFKDETPHPDSPHSRMLEFLAESDRIITEQGLDVPRETSAADE
jgi:hypothetical protein